MYILTKVNWECEIETEAYHNRTIGDALRDIQNEIKAYRILLRRMVPKQ